MKLSDQRRPGPTNREALAGRVPRVTVPRNPDNGFCVLRLKAWAHRELTPVVGHPATVAPGNE